MSLYGPTFHVTPVELCIIFQCNLYISRIMSCGNKIVSGIESVIFPLFYLFMLMVFEVIVLIVPCLIYRSR